MSRFTFYRWIILPSALLAAQRVFETVFGGEPQVAAIRANDFDERFSCKSPIVSLISRCGLSARHEWMALKGRTGKLAMYKGFRERHGASVRQRPY
jgi:hypothetical protein